MAQKTRTFIQFLENINEAFTDIEAKEVNIEFSNIVDKLRKNEILFKFDDKDKFSHSKNMVSLTLGKNQLTAKEMPEEIHYLLDDGGMNAKLIESKNYKDKVLVNLPSGKAFIIDVNNRYRINFTLLFTGDNKMLPLDVLPPSTEELECQFWNGKDVIEAEFEKDEIENDKGRSQDESFYVHYVSIKSEDNREYSIVAGFFGEPGYGEDFGEVEEIGLYK